MHIRMALMVCLIHVNTVIEFVEILGTAQLKKNPCTHAEAQSPPSAYPTRLGVGWVDA